MFIDIHGHLDHPLIQEKFPDIIKRMEDNEVHACTAGIDLASNKKALQLAQNYKNISCFLGVYPRYSYEEHKTDKMSDDEWEKCMQLMTQHKDDLLGIGEIGLDFSQHFDQKQQETDFLEQLKQAEKWNKPVIIHSRKAEERTIELIETTTVKHVIMHCFSGKRNLLKKGVDNGYFFSIPTSVIKATQFQEWIKEVPLQQLFAETDAPYLSPFKDQTNEPSFVIESYKKIAEIKSQSIEAVKEQLKQNFERIQS